MVAASFPTTKTSRLTTTAALDRNLAYAPLTTSLYQLRDTERLMPGIINSPLSDSSVGAVAGMKRPHDADIVPTYGQPHPKKQKVVHQLHHTQPVQHIIDPISAEIGDFGDSKDFFDQQVRRAIAIQCKAMGFDTATPEALEEFRALVDSCTASRVARYAHPRRTCWNPQLIKHRHD